MTLLSQTFFAGLDILITLESLSLAYNLVTSDEIKLFNFDALKQLKILDLGRNLLDYIPENICTVTRLVVMLLLLMYMLNSCSVSTLHTKSEIRP